MGNRTRKPAIESKYKDANGNKLEFGEVYQNIHQRRNEDSLDAHGHFYGLYRYCFVVNSFNGLPGEYAVFEDYYGHDHEFEMDGNVCKSVKKFEGEI